MVAQMHLNALMHKPTIDWIAASDLEDESAKWLMLRFTLLMHVIRRGSQSRRRNWIPFYPTNRRPLFRFLSSGTRSISPMLLKRRSCAFVLGWLVVQPAKAR